MCWAKRIALVVTLAVPLNACEIAGELLARPIAGGIAGVATVAATPFFDARCCTTVNSGELLLALCGDPDAQLEEGKWHAEEGLKQERQLVADHGEDARGIAQGRLIVAYTCLRLAEDAGNKEAATEVSQLKLRLTPDDIAQAEKSVSEFEPAECPGQELKDDNRKTR